MSLFSRAIPGTEHRCRFSRALTRLPYSAFPSILYASQTKYLQKVFSSIEKPRYELFAFFLFVWAVETVWKGKSNLNVSVFQVNDSMLSRMNEGGKLEKRSGRLQVFWLFSRVFIGKFETFNINNGCFAKYELKARFPTGFRLRNILNKYSASCIGSCSTTSGMLESSFYIAQYGTLTWSPQQLATILAWDPFLHTSGVYFILFTSTF